MSNEITISNEIIYRVYDMFLIKNKKNYEDLTKIGIDDILIEELLNRNIIKKINSFQYDISSIDNLYTFGVKKWKCMEYDNAIIYFEKCLEMDNTNRSTKLYLIFLYTKRKKIPKAFEIYDTLEDTEKELTRDNKLILYLLSLVGDYPDEYIDEISKIKPDDIMIPNNSKRYQNIQIHNKLRTSIINNELNKAKAQMESISSLGNYYPSEIDKILIEELILSAYSLEEKRLKYLLEYANNKNYISIISMLNHKHQKTTLNYHDICVYHITGTIIKIVKTKTPPQVTPTETTDLKEALRCNDFNLAFRINNGYSIKKGNYFEKKTINILLQTIISLINSLNKDNNKKRVKKPNY